MITITDRRSTDGFLQLYKSHGVTVSTVSYTQLTLPTKSHVYISVVDV